MPKLVTPVQYEPSLNQLNDIRPLKVADESKTLLDIPVIDSNSVSDSSRVIGKLLRCDNAGAILSYLEKGAYDNVEVIEQGFTESANKHKISFAQKVAFVLSVVEDYVTTDVVWWTDIYYYGNIKQVSKVVPTFLEFSGIDLYIKALIGRGGFATMKFYGIY